jgi:chromate transport protein ChrA
MSAGAFACFLAFCCPLLFFALLSTWLHQQWYNSLAVHEQLYAYTQSTAAAVHLQQLRKLALHLLTSSAAVAAAWCICCFGTSGSFVTISAVSALQLLSRHKAFTAL